MDFISTNYNISRVFKGISACEVQDSNYCMSFANAMQALLGQNYNSFLLTILSTTVGFYYNDDGKFKIFDSHGRDSYGMPHPQGTCVQ